jgi:hypothetical protein
LEVSIRVLIDPEYLPSTFFKPGGGVKMPCKTTKDAKKPVVKKKEKPKAKVKKKK